MKHQLAFAVITVLNDPAVITVLNDPAVNTVLDDPGRCTNWYGQQKESQKEIRRTITNYRRQITQKSCKLC